MWHVVDLFAYIGMLGINIAPSLWIIFMLTFITCSASFHELMHSYSHILPAWLHRILELTRNGDQNLSLIFTEEKIGAQVHYRLASLGISQL